VRRREYDDIRARLWGADGAVLYGRTGEMPREVRDAVRGATSTALTDDERTLRTAAPVVRSEGDPNGGAGAA
jgi:hypothetical protein